MDEMLVDFLANCIKQKKENPANYVFAGFSYSTPSGARTPDTLIKSQVLYQLS